MKASGMCGSDLHQYRRGQTGGASVGGIAGRPDRSSPVTSRAASSPRSAPASAEQAGADRPARHGAPLRRLHRLQPLPLRLVAAVLRRSRSPSTATTRMAATRIVHEGAGLHAGAAADALSFATGAAISCGTGTAYGALRRIQLSGNDTIAIFGQGPVGLSATQLAAAMGARVIALDVERGAAQARQGIRRRRDRQPRHQRSRSRAIKDLTHGYGADFTLDTSGAARDGRIAAVRARQGRGARPASSASATTSRSTSAPTCCASS